MSKLDSVKESHYVVIPFVNCEAHKAPCDTFAKLPDRPLNSQFAIPRSTAPATTLAARLQRGAGATCPSGELVLTENLIAIS